VILYCNTARRISHTYTVLRHLGYETVDFYEGSLTEWERDGRPVETGR
jgi:thiosulfate/3-mercaptopyruvate sulfurtransferase